MEHETTSKPCTCAQVYERLRDQIAARTKSGISWTLHCEAHPPGSPEWEQLLAALQEPGMKVVDIPPAVLVSWLSEGVGVALEQSPVPLHELLDALVVEPNADGEAIKELLRSAIAFRDAARRMREHARTHSPRRKK